MKKMKYVLGALAIALTLCMPMAAIAAGSSGQTGASSDVEGVLSKSIFSVVLPTLASPDNTYKFHIDPNQIVKATGGSRYGTAAVDPDATLIFTQNDTGTKKYSDRSNALSVINKSTFGVTATVEARITSSATIDYVETLTDTPSADTGVIKPEISMYAAEYTRTASGKNYNYDKVADTEVYLQAPTAAELAADSTLTGVNAHAVLKMDLNALAERTSATDHNRTGEAYEYKWANNAYNYELKAAFTKNFNFDTHKNAGYFALAGAANKNTTDWASASSTKPSITVKWTIEPTKYAFDKVAATGTTVETNATTPTRTDIKVGDNVVGSYTVETSADGTTYAAVKEAATGERCKVVFVKDGTNGTDYALKSVKITPTASDKGTLIKEKTLTADTVAWAADNAWFDMPDSPVELTVEPAKAFALTYSAANGGSFDVKTETGKAVASGSKVFEGGKVVVTVTPNAGKVVDTVKLGDDVQTAQSNGSYLITMPAAAKAIAVTFKDPD